MALKYIIIISIQAFYLHPIMTNLISTIDSELFYEHQSVIEKFNVIVHEFRQ